MAPLLPLPPAAVFLLQRFGVSFGLSCWTTYANVRRVTELGFDPMQLVVVGTVLQVTLLASEIPSGVAADVYGRRRAMVVGFAMIGAGFGVEASSSAFLGVLFAQLPFGLGWALISGARAAWLVDEIGESRAVPLLLRGAQLVNVGSLAGIVAAGLLVQLSLVLPLQVGAATLLSVALLAGLCMTETGFRAQASRRPWALSLVRTLRDGFAQARAHRAASTVITAELFLGASGEIFDRLWQLHLLTSLGSGLPPVGPLPAITWFAILEAGGYILAVPALAWARRHVNQTGVDGLPGLLARVQLLATLAAFGFAVAWSFPMLVLTYWLFTVMRRTVNPLGSAWVNQQLDSSVRATVLSIVNLATSLGGVGGGLLGGALGRAFGVGVALGSAASSTLPALGLFASATRDDQAAHSSGR